MFTYLTALHPQGIPNSASGVWHPYKYVQKGTWFVKPLIQSKYIQVRERCAKNYFQPNTVGWLRANSSHTHVHVPRNQGPFHIAGIVAPIQAYPAIQPLPKVIIFKLIKMIPSGFQNSCIQLSSRYCSKMDDAEMKQSKVRWLCYCWLS